MTGTLRSAIVRALESLEDGDPDGAGAILRSALHRPAHGRHTCPGCGLPFRWPGLLEEHLRVFHPELWEATVAA